MRERNSRKMNPLSVVVLIALCVACQGIPRVNPWETAGWPKNRTDFSLETTSPNSADTANDEISELIRKAMERATNIVRLQQEQIRKAMALAAAKAQEAARRQREAVAKAMAMARAKAQEAAKKKDEAAAKVITAATAAVANAAKAQQEAAAKAAAAAAAAIQNAAKKQQEAAANAVKAAVQAVVAAAKASIEKTSRAMAAQAAQCVDVQESGGGLPKDYNISLPTWLLTPSIVKMNGKGHYRAIGRVIHAEYLKERLVGKEAVVDKKETEEGVALIEQLDILADTLYIKDTVELYGIKKVKIYAREIVAPPESKLSFYSPNQPNNYTSPAATGRKGNAGNPGKNGEKGLEGPQVDIFTDVITGKLDVSSYGGNGQRGQDGGKGGVGRDNGVAGENRRASYCTDQSYRHCSDVDGPIGNKGHNGGNGGNAGKPGNGGDGGLVTVRYRAINGNVLLKTCGGVGAEAANNGEGGEGGKGSKGGSGRECRRRSSSGRDWSNDWCEDKGALESRRGDNGPDGDKGKKGTTSPDRGKNGKAENSFIKHGQLEAANKKDFPVELVKIMRRRAEDLLISDISDQTGKDTLRFILSLAKERSDLEEFKRDAQRKLGFLGQEGYDIFGRNQFFAPRVRWNVLEDRVRKVKEGAKDYEDAFNKVMAMDNIDSKFKDMARTMSQIESQPIEAQIKQLTEAKRIAQGQKRMNVKAIKTLEEQMTSLLLDIMNMLPDAYGKAKFHRNDLITVLQGLTGFAKSIASKNPLDTIDAVLGTVAGLSGKICLKSLPEYIASADKWLTFGKNYTALENPSDLDFDQIDVSAVPEMMKVNLEMNKENFAAELVCLFEVAPLQPDVALLKARIESFFIAGSTRVDLIANVMDLDNDMGGYNFDIPVLNETKKAIIDLGKSPADSISTNLKQTFTENLLTTYQELEHAFIKKIYDFYKAIEFRTLWDANNPLAGLRRGASESAQGTLILNGQTQFTKVYTKVNNLKDDAVNCFSRHNFKTDYQKWTFDKTKDKTMFEELASGRKTNFSIDIDNSCETCYNVRLLKIYIELFGTEEQPDNVPSKVYLYVRHRNSSYFRAGDKKIRRYVQRLEPRSLAFDRYTITDAKKCAERKKNGEDTGTYCLDKQDSRWESMCTDPLSVGKDILLGADECVSPFGIYELQIPVDKDLECGSSIITASNCKDLDLSKFTKMNVWTYFYYWVGRYPLGPDDAMCSKRRSRRLKFNQTTPITP